MVAAFAAGLCASRFAAPKQKAVAAQAQKKAAAKKEAAKKDEPPISAPHAILIDAENGAVLFERDPDQLIFPASLGKLMTVEYVFHELKEGRIKLTDEYMVSENAWRKGGAPSHGSTMYAALHSRVAVDDLLHGMIIQSGNDACIVLAEGIAGNEAEFAAKMTKRAREIGLTKSVFTNSNGLPDPGEKVTTRELGLLARHIIRNYPEFYPIFGEREFTWNKIRQQNRNPLLAMEHRRRRLEDRLHQGGRLRPGRLGGAERLAAGRGGQWPEDRQGARRRSQEIAGMGLPQFRAAHFVRRRPDHRRGQGLWRRQRPRAAGGDRPGARDAAEERRRKS